MNKKGQNKTLLMISITLVMLVLGGVAVVTAWRLRQLSTEPVAPTAPQSQPQAAGGGDTPDPDDRACIMSFTVVPSVCGEWCDEDSDCTEGHICYIEGLSGGVCKADTDECTPEQQDANCNCPTADSVSCQNKQAYFDASSNTPGNYDLTEARKIDTGETVAPGSRIVYAVTMTSSNANGTATVVDPLASQLTFLDASSECSLDASNRVKCDYTGPLPHTVAYRVQVASNIVANVTIPNTATVIDENAEESTCSESVQVAVGPTSTPQPTSPQPTNPPGVTSAPTPIPTTVPGEIPQAGSITPTLGIMIIGGIFILAGLTGLLFR